MNIVFHSAATVKFDEELTKSVGMNVEAVFSLVELCKKMRKLEVVLKVLLLIILNCASGLCSCLNSLLQL